MRTEAEMKCDVCGCVTSHLTIAKPPERPKDECQKCYWTRELNVEGLKAERYAAVAEAWRLNAVEMERDAAIAKVEVLTFEVGAATRARDHMRGERDAALADLQRVVEAAEVITFSPLSIHAEVRTLRDVLDALNARKRGG